MKYIESDGKIVEQEKKIAVLIDAENISNKYINLILNEANTLGNVIYKRIYGDWTMQNMSSWKEVILDNSIQPIQQYRNTTGKNSTDSSLIIDTMDLLYLGRLNSFCIVTSDSDFTRLAARLRESEMYVLGMGEQKTPRSFISACNRFAYLDVLYEKSQQVTENGDSVTGNPKAAVKKVNIKNIEKIKQSLHEIAKENADNDGWVYLGMLGSFLSKKFPKFDVKKYGYSKLGQFVESLDMFETKQNNLNFYYKLK